MAAWVQDCGALRACGRVPRSACKALWQGLHAARAAARQGCVHQAVVLCLSHVVFARWEWKLHKQVARIP